MTAPLLTYGKPAVGKVAVDLDRLVTSRMLVQANSGGGKSRAIRQLLEETHGRVQHLVIDPEGEFATLRERFDYILAAKQGGDTIAMPRYAKRLCRYLVELRASTVLDLYDLTLDERREFVRHFLTELMSLPRALWHPIIVVIDEMHVFAPEAGQAQSAEAVTALATQGRKRGFCLVGATQRISKLHKDVAAELLNKMIGRTGLDIDVKRAGDELGMGKDERAALKTLAPGEFFVYGPAIANEVAKVKTGDVVTSHPEAGRIGILPPPPSAKVRAMLAQLADLPKEAEEEARTLDDLKKQNAELARKLRQAEKGAPAATPRVVEKTVIDREEVQRLAMKAFGTMAAAKAKEDAGAIRAGRAAVTQLERSVGEFTAAIEGRVVPGLRLMLTALESPASGPTNGNGGHSESRGNLSASVVTSPRREPPAQPRRVVSTTQPSGSTDGEAGRVSALAGDLSKAEQKILDALRELELIGVSEPSRAQLGMMAGYNLIGGSGGQYVADLGSKGLVAIGRGSVSLTDAGHERTEHVIAPGSVEEVHERALAKVGDAERKILAHLLAIWPDAITRADLGAAVDYNLIGGSGGQYLANLITLGFADIPKRGEVVAGRIMFPDSLR